MTGDDDQRRWLKTIVRHLLGIRFFSISLLKLVKEKFSSLHLVDRVAMGTFIVREDFLARTSDELTVRKGDVVIDGLPSGYGWVQGECRGKIGSVTLHLHDFLKTSALILDTSLPVFSWYRRKR